MGGAAGHETIPGLPRFQRSLRPFKLFRARVNGEGLGSGLVYLDFHQERSSMTIFNLANIQTRLLIVGRETFPATRITPTVRMCLSCVITNARPPLQKQYWIMRLACLLVVGSATKILNQGNCKCVCLCVCARAYGWCGCG